MGKYGRKCVGVSHTSLHFSPHTPMHFPTPIPTLNSHISPHLPDIQRWTFIAIIYWRKFIILIAQNRFDLSITDTAVVVYFVTADKLSQ